MTSILIWSHNCLSLDHPGNSKLTLILPGIVADSVVHDTTRKRSHDEMASEVDDGAPQANVNEANRYASNEEQSVPSTAKMSYKEMIDSAFDSYELNLDEDDSVLQTELVDWIASKYYKLQDDSETRKQSLRKGLYSILMKHYERIGSDDTNKRQKRGTIRWRTNQVNNQGPPDSDLPPTST